MHLRQVPMLSALLVLVFSAPVQASSWPDDVTVSGLGTWDDDSVDSVVASAAYESVVNEMGIAIANKPLAPGETLGIYGFDLGFSSTLAFIHSHDSSAAEPSDWTRVDPTGEPAPVLWIPWIMARKGLPFSLEVGANVGYIAFSRQTVFGGYGRWGLLEGYHPIPDISLQVGYSGYVGNKELGLGVMDVGGTIGWTLPFGTLVGINQAEFSPFLGVTLLRIRAVPLLPTEDLAVLGISSDPISGFKNSDYYSAAHDLEHINLSGGFRIVNGGFQLRIAATYAVGQIATLNAGLGFAY